MTASKMKAYHEAPVPEGAPGRTGEQVPGAANSKSTRTTYCGTFSSERWRA